MFGIVSNFSALKGYGFITPEDKTPDVEQSSTQTMPDVFVHFSDLEMDGYKTIEPGQRVSFELGTIEKNGLTKPKAVKVRVV